MGSQGWVADWEQIVERDLARHLAPAGESRHAYRPAGLTGVPDGAHAALSRSAGRIDPGGMLVIPAAVRPWRGWRRHSLYTPASVAGIGEHAVGLWVQALPAPGVRVRIPFRDIAAVQDQAGGSSRVIAVIGVPGRLQARCPDEGRAGADGWIRLLRQCAAPVPAPVPQPRSGGHRLRGRSALESVLLDAGEDIVWAGWRSRARCAAFLLALTPRELIVVLSRAEHRSPRRVIRRTLYLPRQSLQDVGRRADAVTVRSAGTEVNVKLWSRRVAAQAAAWLGPVLGDHNRSDAGT